MQRLKDPSEAETLKFFYQNKMCNKNYISLLSQVKKILESNQSEYRDTFNSAGIL